MSIDGEAFRRGKRTHDRRFLKELRRRQLVARLVDIAMSELHHDGGDGELPVEYERARLRKLFGAAVTEAWR